MSHGIKTETKGPIQAASAQIPQEAAPTEQQPEATPAGRILRLQRKIGNQRVQGILTGKIPAPKGENIQAAASPSTIQREDFEGDSPDGDHLHVVTQSAASTGEVRHWAAPNIISMQGDRVPYHIMTEVVRDHRPYTVRVGVRRIATGEMVVERNFEHLQLLRWQQAGNLNIPEQGEAYGPAEGMEFFVRLEPAAGEPVEYRATLEQNEDAVELARVLNGEGGGSLQGMMALSHVVQNRLATGRPAGQIGGGEHPRNFIQTAYLLRGSESVAIPASWQRSPSTASRQFAQAIINSGGAVGNDPTQGTLFYCTAGTERRMETSRPGFQRLARQVEQGYLQRITVAGNTFYGRGPQAGSAPPGTEVACRL